MNGFVYVKKKINYNYRPFLKTVYKVCLFHHCIFNKRSDSYRFFLSVLINACYLKVRYLKRQPKIFKSCRKICNSYNTVMFVTRTPKYTILRKRSLTRKHPTPISCIPYISTPTCCLQLHACLNLIHKTGQRELNHVGRWFFLVEVFIGQKKMSSS